MFSCCRLCTQHALGTVHACTVLKECNFARTVTLIRSKIDEIQAYKFKIVLKLCDKMKYIVKRKSKTLVVPLLLTKTTATATDISINQS